MFDCHNGNNSSLNPEIIRSFIVRFRKTVGRLITVCIMDLYLLSLKSLRYTEVFHIVVYKFFL